MGPPNRSTTLKSTTTSTQSSTDSKNFTFITSTNDDGDIATSPADGDAKEQRGTTTSASLIAGLSAIRNSSEGSNKGGGSKGGKQWLMHTAPCPLPLPHLLNSPHNKGHR